MVQQLCQSSSLAEKENVYEAPEQLFYAGKATYHPLPVTMLDGLQKLNRTREFFSPRDQKTQMSFTCHSIGTNRHSL